MGSSNSKTSEINPSVVEQAIFTFAWCFENLNCFVTGGREGDTTLEQHKKKCSEWHKNPGRKFLPARSHTPKGSGVCEAPHLYDVHLVAEVPALENDVCNAKIPALENDRMGGRYPDPF